MFRFLLREQACHYNAQLATTPQELFTWMLRKIETMKQEETELLFSTDIGV